MANGDIVDIKPSLEQPQKIVKKFVMSGAEVIFVIPRLDQNGQPLGHQQVGFTMDELPQGAFRTSVIQLIRRVLEREGLVEPLP